ncbi:MAG: hypothetical protein MJ128_05325 [Mogibacterium sp.]|nr:hypothetical protein [Mogibacterium sp.]
METENYEPKHATKDEYDFTSARLKAVQAENDRLRKQVKELESSLANVTAEAKTKAEEACTLRDAVRELKAALGELTLQSLG